MIIYNHTTNSLQPKSQCSDMTYLSLWDCIAKEIDRQTNSTIIQNEKGLAVGNKSKIDLNQNIINFHFFCTYLMLQYSFASINCVSFFDYISETVLNGYKEFWDCRGFDLCGIIECLKNKDAECNFGGISVDVINAELCPFTVA